MMMKTNMKYKKAGLLIGLIAGAVAPAMASAVISVPSVGLNVDGQSYELPRPVPAKDENGKDIWIMEEWKMANSEFEITLGATLNPDPSIAYGIAVIDLGAPSAFAFFFSTPIVPTGSPNTVSGSVVGGLTDATGNGVSITPTGSSLQINDLIAPITNMGVDVGIANVHPASGTPGSFFTYGAYAAGPIAGPGPGPWTGINVSLGFTLSGGGDVAALTGFASIDPTIVPETSTTLAGGALALGVAGWAFRRRNRA